MPTYKPQRRWFAPKTADLKGINDELYEVAEREQKREKALKQLLDITVKMKRLTKDIILLISKGSKEMNVNRRTALETKINSKIEELNDLRDKHLREYNTLTDISPWRSDFRDVEFQANNN